MKVIDFLNTTDLEDSLLLGYYGGGNFGDELILEILLNIFGHKKISDISVFYLSYVNFNDYHKQFSEYKIITSKFGLLWQLFKKKNIIIGGGGIWGLDFNKNVFILSLIIFFSKFILRKKVFLLSVGYYNSTSRFGKFAAFLVGISSDIIISRDHETFLNFNKISERVFLDRDIAFNLGEIDDSFYAKEVKELEEKINLFEKNIFITIRRFKDDAGTNFQKEILKFLERNKNKNVILSLLETKIIDKTGYKFLQNVSKLYKNVEIMDFNYNPLALVFLLKKYYKNIAIISPQLHSQMIAYLVGASFLPISYDNKNIEFFKIIECKKVSNIKEVTSFDLENFADNFYGYKK